MKLWELDRLIFLAWKFKLGGKSKSDSCIGNMARIHLAVSAKVSKKKKKKNQILLFCLSTDSIRNI